MSILIFLLPILAKLQTKFFRHFYRIGFNFYKWWTGPPIRITKHIRDFAKSIEPDEWEWKADAKSGGEEHFRFELSDWSSRDSLHIDIVSRATQIEARLILWHQGETFDSGTLISRETDDIHTIRCGPLLLDVREPFRRCRFFYRGEIRNSQNEPIFLSIGGWFKPTSDVRFFYSNLQVNEEILKNPWRILSNFRKFNKQREQKDFVQWGEAFCEIEMNRVAVRRRFRGLKEVRRLSANDREDQISVYFEDGHRYFWRSEDRAQYNSHLEHGIHSHVDQIVRSISLDTPEGVYQPDSLSILKFKTNQGQEESFTKMKHLNKCSYERDDGVTIVVNRFECDRKGSIGYAFISSIIQPLDKKECKQRVEAILDYKAIGLERILRIIPLTHRACQDSSLTGGKGSNLGKLSTIRCKYQVPNGFVISTNAYEEHLKANKALSQLINRINHNLKIDELESLLKKIEAAFHESELTLAMRTELEIVLRNEFAEKLLAIRSSAIGEDGADLSSAGQLESQLNIQPKDVQQTLKRVWASNFRKEVYSYRKFYAQLLTPSMAIVVQEMISNGTAGVMFTCNPVTRDPTKFLINAHQGMGEEIVSGAVTPHTALIAKHNGEILEKSEEILCLEDSQLLELTKVGHFLETHFGKPQDVEFVIKNEVIYLVQSRDVTGLDRESDFELSTEFDSGNLTDHEIYTTANVGEVLPRPLTPLGISVEAQLYEKALCKMFFSFGSTHIPMHHHMAFHITNNRVFFNVGELYLRQWVVLEKDPLSEYTLAGERMISTEMYRQGKLRYKPSHPLFPIYRLGYMIHATLWGGKSTLKTVEFGSKAIQELVSDGKAQRQLENIQQQQELFAKLIYNHSYISSCSSFTYIIVAMLIRGSPEGDLTPEMLSDIATLFGNNSLSVISADVPNALKNIAKAITKSKVQPEFETLEAPNSLKPKIVMILLFHL
ncbi:unnamed protein product, partial [Mesorhabditis belari]|uniref:Pyruvate phosphate dikinase AMP/ATP-binding domain-containing protein n=1 Tax=Mesorhabditis belari TaxID=2138241 RepID=A0AAF3ELT7_9BILA